MPFMISLLILSVTFLWACCRRAKARLALIEAGIFRPEDYGAKGNGVADDTAAFIAACTAMAAFGSGATLLGRPHAVYLLYPNTWQTRTGPASLGPLGSFSGLANLTFEFSRSTLRVPRTVAYQEWWGMFRFSECRWIRCAANFVGHNHSGNQNVAAGAVPFAFNGACRHVEVTGHYEGCFTPALFAAGAYTLPESETRGTDNDALRTIGVRLDLTVKNSGYGANFIFSGDFAQVRLITEGVYRSYFPYGVKQHDVQVVSRGALGADCLLKAAEGYGLEDIRLRYSNTDTHTGGNGGGACVEIDWGDDDPAAFRKLWIDVDVRYHPGSDFGPALRVVRHGTAAGQKRHALLGLRFGGIVRAEGRRQVPIDFNFAGDTHLETWSAVVLEDLRLIALPATVLDVRGVVDQVTTRRVVSEADLSFTLPTSLATPPPLLVREATVVAGVRVV